MIYTYIDDFLPETFCNELYNLFISDSFMWSYFDKVSANDKTNHFYFVHTFFIENKINDDNVVKMSEFFVPFIIPIISRCDKILRIRCKWYSILK